MPVYTYICPLCGEIKESLQSMEDRFILQCDCGKLMERYWQADLPQIVGETCPGGVAYSGYDENLGEVVLGPAHRREVMRRKGLAEYSPDPGEKHIDDEIKYVKKHSRPQEGKGAVDALVKEKGRRRKRKIIKERLGDISKSASE